MNNKLIKNMKKTYIIPELDVMLIAPNTIIANSPGTSIDPSDPGVPPGDFEVKGQVNGSGSSNVWDDDWSR